MGPNAKGALLALFGFAVFSTHDVIVKTLGGTYSPYQLLFFNVLFGFPLLSFMLVRDSVADTLRPRHPWWTVVRMVSITIASASIFYAFSVLPLAQTYSILFLFPLFITLLSIPMLGEKIGIQRGGAMLLGLAGVLIVLQPGTTTFGIGHVAALVGVFFSALGSIIVRRVGRAERNLVLLLFPMLGNFIVMGTLMPFTYVPMPLADLAALALMSLLGFIGLNCMIIAYQWAEAVVVAPMQYSQMIWATIFGTLLFGDRLETSTVVGTLVIVVSGLIIVLREGRKNISDNTPVLRSGGRLPAGAMPEQSVARDGLNATKPPGEK